MMRTISRSSGDIKNALHWCSAHLTPHGGALIVVQQALLLLLTLHVLFWWIRNYSLSDSLIILV